MVLAKVEGAQSNDNPMNASLFKTTALEHKIAKLASFTEFNSCALCFVRATMFRSAYKDFKGEWWKDKDIVAQYDGKKLKRALMLKYGGKEKIMALGPRALAQCDIGGFVFAFGQISFNVLVKLPPQAVAEANKDPSSKKYDNESSSGSTDMETERDSSNMDEFSKKMQDFQIYDGCLAP
jgi:hypothetical protein